MQEYIARSLFDIDRTKGGQCGKAKSNIFLHWPTNSVNKSFIASLTNPNNFIEEIDPTQQDSLAESSCELTSSLLVHRD